MPVCVRTPSPGQILRGSDVHLTKDSHVQVRRHRIVPLVVGCAIALFREAARGAAPTRVPHVKDFNVNPGTAFSTPNFATVCGIAPRERMKLLVKAKGETPVVVEPRPGAEPNLPVREVHVSTNVEMAIAFSPLGYVMGIPTVMKGKMSSIVRVPMTVNLSVLIPRA